MTLNFLSLHDYISLRCFLIMFCIYFGTSLIFFCNLKCLIYFSTLFTECVLLSMFYSPSISEIKAREFSCVSWLPIFLVGIYKYRINIDFIICGMSINKMIVICFFRFKVLSRNKSLQVKICTFIMWNELFIQDIWL